MHQQTLGLTAEDYRRLPQTTVAPVVPVVPVEKDIFCAALCSAAVVYCSLLIVLSYAIKLVDKKIILKYRSITVVYCSITIALP